MSDADNQASWADNVDMSEDVKAKSDVEFLEEILEDEELDTRRSIDLLMQMMNPNEVR